MQIEFFKYEGTGNDFVIIDNRSLDIKLKELDVAFLCDRKFGIGADGLMLLQNHEKFDFEMFYFNSDGKPGTMCGNGGRCISAFANYIGIAADLNFIAIDGMHQAKVEILNDKVSIVNLKMTDVDSFAIKALDYFVDSGSPHHIKFVKDIHNYDVFKKGEKIRHSEDYENIGGVNVNFVEEFEDYIYVRTFERGVEDETLSCGTGVTASAIATAIKNENIKIFKIKTKGGDLEVKFDTSDNKFENVWLKGSATFVFKGVIDLDC
ncbi:MAG: diaminopimelate epimerase [Saprospiraceae bacterium]|nr:diaminopimelate epimerase [Saprospiraceae bacterium]